MWRSIKEYATAVLRWWWVVPITVIGSMIAQMLKMRNQESAHHMLNSVLDEGVIERLKSVAQPTEQLKHRIEILSICDSKGRKSSLHAWKTAWADYLAAASTCGMFDGDDGKELLSRLRGRDDDGFRSAIAECFACWFFAKRLQLAVFPRPHGRPGKRLEFGVQLPTGLACVEVKAPYRKPPQSRVWSGDDADKLADSLDQANKQFSKDATNILVIVPRLRTRVCAARYQLVRAFLGETKITVPIDTDTGASVGPAEAKFFQEGKFLKLYRDKGGCYDLTPRFTRVGAVVCIEDYISISEPRKVSHSAVVLVNPFADKRIDHSVFSPYPQIPLEDNSLQWSDGRDGFK